MCRFKYITVCATLVSVFWLTGCASAATKAEEEELKRTTVQRWTACLERNATASEMPAIQVNKLMRKECEGHKRDVLALYPRNMADEIDQMLTTSAYRIIESMGNNNKAAVHSGSQVQTLLR